mgnify:CR=1 FL=1
MKNTIILLMLALLVSACTKPKEDISLVGTWTLCDDERTQLEFRSDNTVWWWYRLDNGTYLSINGEYGQEGTHIWMTNYGQSFKGDIYGIRSADLDSDRMNVLAYTVKEGHMEFFTDTYKKEE